MDLVIVNSDNPFGSCVRVITQGAAQERKETEPIDEPNRIPPVRILRRPARPASLHTAYAKREESHNCPSKRSPPERHFISCHKSKSPKYEDQSSIHVQKEPTRRRRLGSRRKTTPQIVSVVSKEEAPFSGGGLTPTCSRVRGEHHAQMLASTDKIPAASLLLSLAKRSIDRDADWFGQKRPCLMDVVLDLRDLARRSATDALSSLTLMAGVGQFNLQDQDLGRHPFPDRAYTFRDRNSNSLEGYWNDQAAISTGSIWLNDQVGGHSNGFPVSVERSTASWPSEGTDWEV